jgi:hypothetical protein
MNESGRAVTGHTGACERVLRRVAVATLAYEDVRLAPTPAQPRGCSLKCRCR